MVKSQFTEYFNKKKFFFFYPHTLTIRLKLPVYRGFSGEGWCEGKIFTLTLTICLKTSFHCTHLLNKFQIFGAVHNFSKIRIEKLKTIYISSTAKILLSNLSAYNFV